MTTEPKFTGMVVVSGGKDGERGPFQNDVMTFLKWNHFCGVENTTQSGCRK